ncbi:MAG: NAD(P)/FAD-dependent oxidoreductase [Methylocystaceae bacterium]
MRQVIIGGSIAAVGAISGIRSVTPDDEIIVINGEAGELYSRPLISYYLAGNRQQNSSYPYPNFLENNQVTLLNDWVLGIDRENRQIKLKNGQLVAYDRLLLATGSLPVNLNLPGNDTTPVYNFYTQDDADKLRELAPGIQNAVVIGSGLIGIKAAEALHSMGIKVTVLEREAALMPRMLSPLVAARVAAELEQVGISCHPSQQVVSLAEGQVQLKDGTSLATELVIMATGVKPRTELAADCGLVIEQGIVVNEWLQTSDSVIYAAGDVAQVTNLVSSQTEVMALLPLAREQGWAAGVNMAGGKQIYPGGVPLNAVRVGSLAVTSGGLSNNPDLSWGKWQQGDRYLELFARDDRLVGFIALNMPEVGGPIYNSLIRPLNLRIGEWQHFIASPSLSTIPSTYWAQLRRCTGSDTFECC